MTDTSQQPTPTSQLPGRWAPNRQWATVASMYVGYAMFMVLRMIPTVTGPAMREDATLDIDLGVLGRIFALGTCGAVVGKFVGGLAADRWGGKWTFTVGLLLSVAFIGLFSVSTEVWMFQATLFMALLAKSFGWPSMAKIIGNWFRADHYGRVWGVLSTSSRVGTLVATFGLGALLAVMPWRLLLAVAAGAGVLAVVYFACTLREHPDDPLDVGPGDAAGGGHPLARLPLSTVTWGWETDSATVRMGWAGALPYFFSSRQFWLITGSLMGLTVLWDFLLFVPLYLKDTLSLTVSQASMAASAFPLGSLISVLVGGYVFDRLTREQAARVFSLLLTCATGCVATFLLMPHLGLSGGALTALSVGLLFLFGVCVSPCYYIPMSVFSIEFGGPHSGFLIALLDAIAFGGNALFYWFAGEIAEASWQLFLVVLLTVSVVSLVLTYLFLRGETGRLAEASDG